MENLIKMKALECSQHFRHQTSWELSVAFETRDLIQSLMQPFPAQMMLQIKFGRLQDAQIFMFESVDTLTHTLADTRMPAKSLMGIL